MKKIFKSFKYAIRGLKVLALAERNFKIELGFAIFVFALAIFFKLEKWEWGLIALAVSLVFLAELVNTAIEKTLDHLHPEEHEKVRDIKDLSAGAVLLAVIFSVFIGLLIFAPKILNLF